MAVTQTSYRVNFTDVDILVVLKGEVDPIQEQKKTLDIVTEICLEYEILICCVFIFNS